MAEPFGGVVNVDIRDSEPDWSPFESARAPEGAPNVVYIVLDEVGFSAISCYGGPIETPNIRPDRRRRGALHPVAHHRVVPAEPVVPADPVAIAVYLGKRDQFDRSITDFSERYADQNEHDYQALTDAIRSGRVVAETGL
jgi:hypothetical protein